MTSKNFGIGFVVLLASIVAGSYLQHVQAEDDDGIVSKPFKISGGGTLDMLPLAPGSQENHTAVGTATDLGKYHLAEAAANSTDWSIRRIRSSHFSPAPSIRYSLRQTVTSWCCTTRGS